MLTRRQFLSAAAFAAGSALFRPRIGWSQSTPLRTRTIPATGEEVPVIGMGTSGSFEVRPGSARA